MALSLARALRFQGPRSAAFVGAGGKTTAIFQLARELSSAVLITTTTHLGIWQLTLADQHVVAQDPADVAGIDPRGLTLVTGPLADDRAGPLSPEAMGRLHDFARDHEIPLLIEADGARRLPLKAPAGHEPAIPEFVDLVIVVAGLTGIGRPLTEDTVHRPDRFADLSALEPHGIITADAVVRMLTHPEGGRKAIPAQARRVVLLNQADTGGLQAQARGMAAALLGSFDAVVVAQLNQMLVHAVHEPVAGIVLAAGGSTRLGRPKPLLDWHGRPFVRVVAGTASAAGLKPVIVVTGSKADQVAAALDGMQVTIACNREWKSGQSSSIRAGLLTCPASTGAAVFLLADQPQVNFDVIAALVDAHAAELSPIVAPLVMMEQRANPVLFDRDTFPDLLALQGDVGGRAVFWKHQVEYMPWHDDRLLLDVDTEADYRRLIEDDTL
jgi:molybdenum cofactor cytidylyltransferase